MTGAELPEAPRAKLNELRDDPVSHGQYLDFVKCRRFRETLLRHAAAPGAKAPVAGSVRTLLAASAAATSADPVNLSEGVETQFSWGDRASLRSDHPLAKAALVALRQRWPEPLSFGTLLAAACELLGRCASAQDADGLESFLLGAFGLRMVELTAERWNCGVTPGDRPRASLLARQEAQAGEVLTTLAHRRARIDEPLALRLLTLCDGTREAETLRADLAREGHLIDRKGVQDRLLGFARLALMEG
jgi:hypothetical protein